MEDEWTTEKIVVVLATNGHVQLKIIGQIVQYGVS